MGMGCGKAKKGILGSVLGLNKDGTPMSLGASVPGDWSWSTF
jgi:hypothetical protein